MVLDVLPMTVVWLTLFSMILGATSSPCPSTTMEINVTSQDDVHALSDILNCAGQGSFNVTWHLSLTVLQRIEVSNTKNVTISGSGFPTISGGLIDIHDGDDGVTTDGDAGRGTGIFSVANGSTLRLSHLVLEGGDAENGGAVEVLASSSLSVVGCRFRNNNATNGGAIYASASTVFIDGNNAFANNSAIFGGAIYSNGSDIYVDGKTTFSHNSARAPRGSAVTLGSLLETPWSDVSSLLPPDIVSTSLIYSSYYDDSAPSFSGGAICALNGSSVQIDGDSSFSHNYSGRQGGVIFANSSVIAFNGSATFASNSALDSGGVLDIRASRVSVDGTAEFLDNSADFGGVVYSISSEVDMRGSTYFANNEAGNYGGAVYAWASDVHTEGTTGFVNHSAGTFGGAVYATDASEIHMGGSTYFTSNWALFGGGAVFATSSRVYMNGSADLTNNTAAGDGGAIRADDSEVVIVGNAIFARNTAADGKGGAIFGLSSDFSIVGSPSSDEGEIIPTAGGEYATHRGVVFVGNEAVGVGGAMFIENATRLHVSGSTFCFNEARLGGAAYIVAVEDKETDFSSCVFEGNVAEDGGALYLYTGPGIDNFDSSIFRNNFASTSAGAIFHTGSLRLVNTSFLENVAGLEGPAMMSLGFLETLSTVSFSRNSYFCRAGEYGYIVEQETYDTCSLCLDIVCSRCLTGGDDVRKEEGVTTNGYPVCAEPPSGAIAPTSGTTVETLVLEKGYYRTSNQSHDVLECYQEKACLGGGNVEKYCASGYKGPYCAACAEGFAPGINYHCRECTKDVIRSAVGLSVAAGVVALFVVALLFLHLWRAVDDGARGRTEEVPRSWKQKCWSCQTFLVTMLPLTAIKIVATVWQIVSQLDAIAGGVYPEVYRKFVSNLSPINLDLDFILSYSCLFESDFYDHLLVATTAPLLVLVLLAGSYLVAKRRNRSRNSSSSSSSESARLAVLHKHQAAVLYLAFFVYSPVSYKIFQTFACDALDDGDSYLRADYSVSCLTSRHSWYETYSLVMVGVYPVGIPAVFAWLIGRHRHDLVKENREELVQLKPLYGLWAAYKPSRYFYEVIECVRRNTLTAIAAFVLPGTTAQISIVLLFAVVFVFVSEVISPFEKPADMNLYRWGNGIIVASMYVAFLMKIDVGYDTKQALLTFSGVLIAANLFMVVTILLQTALLARVWRRAVRIVDTPIRRTESAVL